MYHHDYKDKPLFRKFVRFMATPKWARKRRKEEGMTDAPVTKKEFAEQHDVAEGTLSSWKNTDAYQELMENIRERWVRDAIPQVIRTAKEVATTPKRSGQRDREMLLKLAGLLGNNTVRHVGTVEHVHSDEDARTMDEDELRRVYKDRLREHPAMQDRPEDELDAMVDAAFGRSASKKAPMAGRDEAEDAEFVITEPGPEDVESEKSSSSNEDPPALPDGP